ncbi:MAG: poly-gamma-glutamate hydrolase family protein [Thermoanaerobaculia bacterium]|nr:poly-gamma-glutamate hydrolase family protein [Thermoanaerobaculia bacterium]
MKPLFQPAAALLLAALSLLSTSGFLWAQCSPPVGLDDIQVGLISTPFPYTSLTPVPADLSVLPPLPDPANEIVRREHAYISSSAARDFGIAPYDRSGDYTVNPNWQAPNPQIRVLIEDQTFCNFEKVTTSTPSDCRAGDLRQDRTRKSSAIFTVVGVIQSHLPRVWIYRQATTGDATSGQYKLFAQDEASSAGQRVRKVKAFPDANNDGMLDNVWARVFITPVSQSRIERPGQTAVVDQHYCEPDGSKGSLTDRALVTGDPRFALLVPHGGAIEKNTSLQIDFVRDILESAPYSIPTNVWELKGEWGDDQTHPRWHITSTNQHEESAFPALRTLLDEPPFSATHAFERTLAMHGFDSDQLDLIVGGGAALGDKCLLVDRIADSLEEVGRSRRSIAIVILDPAYPDGLEISDDQDRDVVRRDLDGDSPHNLVNRLAARGGLQIEQSKALREDTAAQLRFAVARGAARAIGDLLAGADSTTACDAYDPP